MQLNIHIIHSDKRRRNYERAPVIQCSIKSSEVEGFGRNVIHQRPQQYEEINLTECVHEAF